MKGLLHKSLQKDQSYSAKRLYNSGLLLFNGSLPGRHSYGSRNRVLSNSPLG